MREEGRQAARGGLEATERISRRARESESRAEKC